MQRIVSKDNKQIKRLKGLAQKKVRNIENLFLVEGKKIVNEALQSDRVVDTIAMSDSFFDSNRDFAAKSESSGKDIIVIPDAIFKGISSLSTPQGVMASVQIKRHSLSDIAAVGKPLVLLDGISDPGNLGTIIRTADAFGFAGVIMCGDCVDVYNPKTVQATMGSVLRIATAVIDYDDISLIKDSDYTIYGFDLNGADIGRGFEFNGKTALLIGSESKGISETARENCDELIKLPMSGQAESLNAAVAAGIAMFIAGR